MPTDPARTPPEVIADLRRLMGDIERTKLIPQRRSVAPCKNSKEEIVLQEAAVRALPSLLADAEALAETEKYCSGLICFGCRAHWTREIDNEECIASHRETWPHEWVSQRVLDVTALAVKHLNRAEAAERERDAARLTRDELAAETLAVMVQLRKERDALAADNAALHEAIKWTWPNGGLPVKLAAVLASPSPGAALLERLRLLDSLAEAARKNAAHLQEVRDRLAELDAAKGKNCEALERFCATYYFCARCGALHGSSADLTGTECGAYGCVGLLRRAEESDLPPDRGG